TDFDYLLYVNDILLNENYGFKKFEVTEEMLNMTAAQIYNRDTNNNKQTTIEPKIVDNTIKIDGYPFDISFKRTIRVPDDDKTYELPPDLGNFPLTSKNDINQILLPMYQMEAMWINFGKQYCYSYFNRKIAVKIGVGDINIISGKKWIEGHIDPEQQNYIVPPKQCWIDGIPVKVEEKFSYETVSENLVRQFVAVPLESDASIESQLLKKGKISELKGGLQFEFYELYDREFFLTKDKKIIPNNITISEKFKVGDTFY